MKRLFLIFFSLLAYIFLCIDAQGREFGKSQSGSSKPYTVTEGKRLNVRSSPSLDGTILHQLRPYDQVYPADYEIVEAEGYQWIRITDTWGGGIEKDGYVTNLNRFSGLSNDILISDSDRESEMDKAVQSSQAAAKWVLLGLSIIIAFILLRKYFGKNTKEKILGSSINNMRKTFFFNIAPYRSILMLTLILVASVIASLLVIYLIGGGGWLLMWIIKILCIVLVWVGIVACIIGIILCLTGHWDYLALVVFGGFIWYFDDSISRFGEICAESGLTFFKELDIYEFGLALFLQYWKPVLIATLIPLGLFLALALGWLTFSGILTGIDKLFTMRYNINHPCPHCHHPSEPAKYLSKGSYGYAPLPDKVQLRPGMYGLLHITHPVTREKMPTMLLNGRDRLARECANCGHRIQAKEGTDLHLALVGCAMSGKSTLSYRMIAEIIRRAGEGSVTFTDVENTMRDRSIMDKVKSIAEKNRIDNEDMPRKTATNHIGSTQLAISRKHADVPYRLFINDVAGEVFDPSNSANSYDKTRYFRNVRSILMVIDPLTSDFSNCDASPDFFAWVEENSNRRIKKIAVNDIMDTIDNHIEQHGNNASKVHLNIILSKKDLNYLPRNLDHNSQIALREFIENEMGLGNMLYWSKKFASVNIFAVAATAGDEKSNIGAVVDNVIVRQLGIRL